MLARKTKWVDGWLGIGPSICSDPPVSNIVVIDSISLRFRVDGLDNDGRYSFCLCVLDNLGHHGMICSSRIKKVGDSYILYFMGYDFYDCVANGNSIQIRIWGSLIESRGVPLGDCHIVALLK